jgi:ABC-type multidrug transport system permease subunit
MMMMMSLNDNDDDDGDDDDQIILVIICRPPHASPAHDLQKARELTSTDSCLNSNPAAYMGQFLAGVSPNAQVALVLNSTIGTLLINFAGFTRKPSNIPIYWRFLYWALPSHYAIEGITTTQWHDAVKQTVPVDVPFMGKFYTLQIPKTNILFGGQFCPLPGFCQSTDKVAVFGPDFSYDHRFTNLAVLAGMSGAMMVGLWAAQKFTRVGTR